MSIKIYVEGGGNQRITLTKCREGFATYCAKLAPARKLPSIIACGSRDEAFRKFKIAVQDCGADEKCVLLVDSEGKVNQGTIFDHLRIRDRWEFPDVQNHKVFLMVQVMESWFLADRDLLAEYYDGGFLAGALPRSASNIEIIRKEDIVSGLARATRNAKTKGEYHKTKHGFDLLARIDSTKVEKASSHAASFHQFLREQLS